MASYLEQLKEGILSRDMNMIKRAYEGMSGEKLVDRASVSRIEEEEYIARPNAKIQETTKDGGILTKKKPLKINNTNLFKDTGENGDKPVIPLKNTPKPPKSKFFVDVTCGGCNKKFTVSRRALPVSLNGLSGREEENRTAYTCDDCISRRR